MKVALVTPWNNAWIPLYKKAFEKRGHEFTLLKTPESGFDVVLHGWAVTKPVRGSRNIMFLRRYELFAGALSRNDWPDALICVNSWIREIAERHAKCPVHLIYNAFDPSKWKFGERTPVPKIGMACHIHPKKNLPLALQVVGDLPSCYELHIAGDVQDSCTAEYLNYLGEKVKRKIYLYGHVEALDLWWEQMGYCLSTSISEGNPNNVIEAMAKGIKPIIHNWPGAEDQFPEDLIFENTQDAMRIIHSGYDSYRYREWVNERYSLKNIERVVDICEGR